MASLHCIFEFSSSPCNFNWNRRFSITVIIKSSSTRPKEHYCCCCCCCWRFDSSFFWFSCTKVKYTEYMNEWRKHLSNECGSSHPVVHVGSILSSGNWQSIQFEHSRDPWSLFIHSFIQLNSIMANDAKRERTLFILANKYVVQLETIRFESLSHIISISSWLRNRHLESNGMKWTQKPEWQFN